LALFFSLSSSGQYQA